MKISARKIYKVHLQDQEKQQLQGIVKKGTTKARTITRARILLMAEEQKTDKQIYEALDLASSTPHDIRRKYCDGGLKKALYDAPRPGKERKLSGVQEAKVVAIACTKPPDGYANWTLDLLTEEVKEKIGITIGRTAIWKVCLRNEIKPWREKNVGDFRDNT
jgi:putative transposase